MNRIKYTTDRKSVSAFTAVIFMTLSAIIRIIYFAFSCNDIFTLLTQFVLPVRAAVIFILVIIFFGKEKPQLTFIPVILGVIFFMIKAFTFASQIHTVLCLILYTGVLVLYGLTIFGIIKTKYLLYPLFGLPLLYHIFVEDMQLYILAKPAVPFFEWLPEISVLCIMAALLCVSIALKRK